MESRALVVPIVAVTVPVLCTDIASRVDATGSTQNCASS